MRGEYEHICSMVRFTSFTVVSSGRNFHPQEYAHAGRTQKTRGLTGRVAGFWTFLDFLLPVLGGEGDSNNASKPSWILGFNSICSKTTPKTTPKNIFLIDAG